MAFKNSLNVWYNIASSPDNKEMFYIFIFSLVACPFDAQTDKPCKQTLVQELLINDPGSVFWTVPTMNSSRGLSTNKLKQTESLTSSLKQILVNTVCCFS